MPGPLPYVSLLNEFYWKSGADGVLRMQQCSSCEGLIHPPKPACPRCRSTESTITTLSGFGTVVGFTVNHRFALPGLPAPYVIARVAPEEDDRVRLTTRLVDVEPDAVELGMRVQVTFEQVDDVWLPLFRPAAGEPGELPEDEEGPAEIRARVRPMLTTRKFEDDVVLSGVGASDMGRRLRVDPLTLTVQACEAAVADAGLTMDDIDGLSTYPGGGPAGGFGEGGVTALEAALRIRPTWYNGGAETFGPGGSVIAAMLAVSAGLARHVLCFRTIWQSTHDEMQKRGELAPSFGRVPGDSGWSVPFGATSAAHGLAINAQAHFRKYGTTRETLGWIALNQRANAALNPTATYRDPMDMDDYLGARLITTPFGLYDCDVPVDASIAVIVSAADAVGDLRQPPVRVEAVGTQLIERVEWDQSTSTHEPQVLGPAAHLWTRTGLRPDDVDVAQLYDGFTFNCLSWIEALGFCGIGEAKDFLDGGKNIARDGVLPLNTHGGQLSHGRTHGMGLLQEAIVQLRGDGGERQVTDARVAVVSSGGLTPSGVLLLRRD
ncbi:thiolase C-terminal domain-containing protein [Cryptosporangium aurantiacum]|uniref:Acetyl-CoA acetyltransferase n=1 Tax=Cryptosporangium aurantiacum TaxID=134849 RepID=A0A1M7KNK0_9ACTN|nr:OB-fold domain-containing protein [Cryptosporangium aurantiacum]SHM66993.1 Acetyl-CoA acetyltransferase [Cryptosporangium aurantiacum]